MVVRAVDFNYITNKKNYQLSYVNKLTTIINNLQRVY